LLFKAEIKIRKMTGEKPEQENLANSEKKFVDVDEVFRKKGGKLYPIIPKFISGI